MTLYETIFHRYSCRSYDMSPLPDNVLADIASYFEQLQPMLPEMRAKLVFTTPDHVECIQTWKAPHYAVLYTDEHHLNYENIGFVGQMLDLYLQSKGYGCCWLGLGRLDDTAGTLPKTIDGLQFSIMLAFGRPAHPALREPADFKRKALSEIADTEDTRLEVVRLAPSAVNSQPWFFRHDGDILHLYRIRFDPVRTRLYGKYNRFDMGIALAHLAVAYPDSYSVINDASHAAEKGLEYVISCHI